MATSVNGDRTNGGASTQATVVALFEDAIDAEHALLALRKADQAAHRVSLLVRSRQDDRNAGDRAVDVARDLVAVALGAVANWLIGLAELIVSEQGQYLVAGPMGAALTSIGRAPERAEPVGSSVLMATDLSADSLQWVLTEFGFAAKEAEYVEHRLTAGATLIAMSSGEAEEIETARGVFSAHDAVYIGLAETESSLLEATGAVLAAGLDLVRNGEIAVIDTVAPLRPVSDEDGPSELTELRGVPVLCADHVEAGQIDRVLVEETGPAALGADEAITEPALVRYVVVGFGGMLGIGRRRVAVPIELVDLTADPVVVRVDKQTLHRAPAYDEDVPLSRSEEDRLFRYFNLTPYWVDADAGAPASARRRDDDGSDRERDGSGRGDAESSPSPAL